MKGEKVNIIDMGGQIRDIEPRNCRVFSKTKMEQTHRKITFWFKNLSDLFEKIPLYRK